MRNAQRAISCGTALQAALAAFLALLLLVAGSISASQSLHQTLHSDGAASGHLCLACSLSKGNASGPEAPLIAPLGMLVLVCCLLVATDFLLPAGIDFSCSRGRAPPVD